MFFMKFIFWNYFFLFNINFEIINKSINFNDEFYDIIERTNIKINDYLNIADHLLTEPEGIIPEDLDDRELFSILSNFYLENDPTKVQETVLTTKLGEKSEFILI